MSVNVQQTATSEVVEAYGGFCENIRLTSSPVPFINEDAESLSDDSGDSEISDDVDDPLYRGSTVSVNAFQQRFLEIITKYRIPDTATSEILDLFCESLPLQNQCPTLNDLKKERPEFVDIASVVNVDDGAYYLVDVILQLKKIIVDYPDVINFKPFLGSDITSGSIFHNANSDHQKYIYLLLNIDGMKSVFDSKNYKIWPVMASIINLDPFDRIKFRNIVLCVLYYGQSKPNFSHFMEILVSHLEKVTFEHDGILVSAKVVTVVADLPAKAECLNMVQFNGYYGCSLCLIKGSYSLEFHKMTYPLTMEGTLRDAGSHAVHAREATTKKPVYGVKGTTNLSKVICIPCDVPLDPMHLLYLGITKSIFSHVLSKHLIIEDEFTYILLKIRVPLYFQRKPRSLSFFNKFKSYELKHLILYYSCSSFYLLSADKNLTLLFLLLSTFISVGLSDSLTNDDIDICETLLHYFRTLAHSLFGPSTDSYSMHALMHLPSQLRKFGSLWTVSAAPFESSYHHLRQMVTGTRNEAKLIVHRFMLSKSRCNDIRDANMRPVVVGQSLPIDSFDDLNTYNVTLHENAFEALRFKCSNKVFTSSKYSKGSLSSSCFAYTDTKNFVKIDRIIVTDNTIFCLCTRMSILSSLLDLLQVNIPHNLRAVLQSKCTIFEVTYSEKCVLPANIFKGHLIVTDHNSHTFVTIVYNDLEHT